MKKLVLFFLFAFLVTFPISAIAEDVLTVDPVVTNSCSDIEIPTVDIKGYGNQFADYSTDCLDVYSVTNTTSYGSSSEWTSFNNVVGTITDGGTEPGCGMQINQGSYTITDRFDTTNKTILDGVNLTGSADMTTLGGLAACTTATDYSIPFSGDLHQTHRVDNTVSGPICGDVYGFASYTGTQTLDLHVGW